MLKFSAQLEGPCPVRWRSRQAVVALPEHIDVSNVSAIRDQLLGVLNRGPVLVTADMSGTMSCDYAGAEALKRVHQRAVASAAELRLVITSPVVRRVLAISGLGQLVPIYPTLEAALAARPPGLVVPLRRGQAATRTPGSASGAEAPATGQSPGSPAGSANLGLLQNVVDALRDGIALVDEAGVLVLVNRRLEEMFGYEHAGLPGLPLDRLIPVRWQRGLAGRLPGGLSAAEEDLLLAGRRKDLTTVAVRVSFTPVPATSGQLTLTVIRNATGGGSR
jgi:anti-sigma B factor antagonist